MITKKEAAIITAYTGILIGDFDEFRKYIQDILGRPVWSHELADKGLWDEIKKKAKEDFLHLEVGVDKQLDYVRFIVENTYRNEADVYSMTDSEAMNALRNRFKNEVQHD